MALPLLVVDAEEMNRQLEALLAAAKAAKQSQEEQEERKATKKPPIYLFDGMPPWALEGGFGDVGGKYTGGDESRMYENLKRDDPRGFDELVRRLFRDASSSNDQIRLRAKYLLGYLRSKGLI